MAVATVGDPTVLAFVASFPASSDRRRAPPAQTRSASAATGFTVFPAGRPGSDSVPSAFAAVTAPAATTTATAVAVPRTTQRRTEAEVVLIRRAPRRRWWRVPRPR
ncbi:hypothetical protein P9139_17325 [Curtobacterium flaccumfaciens]|nr:hypothetical protein P9139_17325 [Curtobacterium flaccumfaciens]